MLSEVPKQFCLYAIISHYVTIIAIIFSIIRIIPKQKVAFSVGIHCRLQANRIIHHGGIQTTYTVHTVYIAIGTMMPARCKQGQDRLPEAPAAGSGRYYRTQAAHARMGILLGGRCSRAGPTRTGAEATTALARDGWPPLPALCVGGRVCVHAY